jgi:hypothetical protein
MRREDVQQAASCVAAEIEYSAGKVYQFAVGAER